MNLFKNYYHDILNKNSSPCNIQNILINKDIMVNFDNIQNSDSNDYDMNFIKNKFKNINDDFKYSYLLLAWNFSLRLKNEYNTIISNNTTQNKQGHWSNILMS